MSKKFLPSPRYEVLKFCAVSWHFAPDFTLFSTTFAESRFAAHRKVEMAQIFFYLKADGKGMIIGFEIFGFGPSKSLFSTFGKNIGFEGFANLLEKI